MRLTAVNKPWYATVQACSMFGDGRVEQAASLAETVLEHQPNSIEALLVLAAAQVELGLDRRARATVATLKDRFPGLDPEEWLDKAPYRDRDLIERWKKDLVAAGTFAA
jgi:thioredoxin-like negative regulator of GroEL